MKANTRKIKGFSLLRYFAVPPASALVLLLIGAPAAFSDTNQIRIVAPHLKPFGKTYGEWSALWWKWAISQPVSSNPLLDSTGENAANNQSGSVWFIGGNLTYTEPEPGHYVGIVTREIAVPPDKALFFPILNTLMDEVGIEPPVSVQELRVRAAGTIDPVTNMSCTIDGMAIDNLTNVLTTPYRVQSPVLKYWLPPTNNIYQDAGLDISGWQYPAVGDGIYVMLRPLPLGKHTIHFFGETMGPAGTPITTLDITYNITVSAKPRVLSPKMKHYGRSYGEWSAAWWRWAYRMPVTGHPLFDSTGEAAGKGQGPDVWFLGGTFVWGEAEPGHSIGVASRTINIPYGKALFFPIINNVDGVNPDAPQTAKELWAEIKGIQDPATNMTCTIDGWRIPGLVNGMTSPYRVKSPVFELWTPPEDNLYQFWGFDFAGRQYPTVADGVYLMLYPLSRGNHVIRFTGNIMGDTGTPRFSLDITYNVMVGPQRK
jgi:hypothetical protein